MTISPSKSNGKFKSKAANEINERLEERAENSLETIRQLMDVKSEIRLNQSK